jgi:GMP synthase (glutamine-hydrolysing)
MKTQVIILDFGSQTTQLIAKRIRNLGVYCEIKPYNSSKAEIEKINPKAIIFSGGPASLTQKSSPRPDKAIFDLNLPILGICYGLQIITEQFQGKVVKGQKGKEYGEAKLIVKKSATKDKFLKEIKDSIVWMSHGDEVEKMPHNFQAIGQTEKSPYAVIKHKNKPIYALQFHPEVTHTKLGKKFLANFVFEIAKCKKNWKTKDIIQELIERTKQLACNRKVLHAISGGVDSTVMSVILQKALGKNLKCVLVDTGLMRLDEVQNTQKRFKKYLKSEVEVIKAKDLFIKNLKGVLDGEQRRKIIGKLYIDLFLRKLGKNDLLSQGTLYPDVIESAAHDVSSPAETIKTHHNRAKEVIELMKQDRVIEIFKDLFKDEVQAIGQKLGLPQEIVLRQPFPGPGLGIRILGEITKEKLVKLKQADRIVIDELKQANLYYKISQTVVALDSHLATAVKGDERASGYLIFIRNIKTSDFMTIDPYYLKRSIRRKITSRILNEVPDIARVLFDESQKPPATVCYL